MEENTNKEQISLNKIIKEQQDEQKDQLEREVLKMTTEKDEIIKSVVDQKKCAIMFGMKEKHTPVKSSEDEKEPRR